MSKISKAERFRTVIEYFSVNRPDPGTELKYTGPYQLVVAVILSAQCTDKRVNIITRDFFREFPGPGDLAKASEERVYRLIRSCSYPNNKTKHLIGMAKVLVRDFNGEIVPDVEQLQKLPGIGRKSANVIASVIYNMPVMPVDTHVFRVSSRIGLTTGAKTPLQAEKQLVRHFPEKIISRAHHWLILHGRYVCAARNPKCDACGLKTICRYYHRTKTGKSRSHS